MGSGKRAKRHEQIADGLTVVQETTHDKGRESGPLTKGYERKNQAHEGLDSKGEGDRYRSDVVDVRCGWGGRICWRANHR